MIHFVVMFYMILNVKNINNDSSQFDIDKMKTYSSLDNE
jgi:hypothetical protein